VMGASWSWEVVVITQSPHRLLRPGPFLVICAGCRCDHPTVLVVCCDLILLMTCTDGVELRGMSSKAREPAPIISTAEVSLDDMSGPADEVPFEEKMALDEGATHVRTGESARGGAEAEGSTALVDATEGGGTVL
jgi:hypothetical protein